MTSLFDERTMIVLFGDGKPIQVLRFGPGPVRAIIWMHRSKLNA
jgi:hypothetical protein